MYRALWLVLAAWLTAAAPPPPPATLLSYNTVTDLLAGDLWEVTRQPLVVAALKGYGAGRPVVGLGTTDLPGRNGEVLARGTTDRPELLFCDAQPPRPVLRLGAQAMPYVSLGVGDPATAVTLPLPAGELVHAQVAALAAARGIKLAGVRVRGTFREVRYSVAYNLLKTGTPLAQHGADTAPYQHLLAAPEPAEWEFVGFYGAEETTQRLFSIGGKPVHLHATRLDRSAGGHLGAAQVVSGELVLYPLTALVTHQCDLTVSNPRLTGATVRCTLANLGGNGVTHSPLRVSDARGKLLDQDAGPLAPGASRSLELALPRAPHGPLVVQADPDDQLAESDERNNTATAPAAR
jgi:predicted DNA-binding protein with PD1-like motif